MHWWSCSSIGATTRMMPPWHAPAHWVRRLQPAQAAVGTRQGTGFTVPNTQAPRLQLAVARAGNRATASRLEAGAPRGSLAGQAQHGSPTPALTLIGVAKAEPPTNSTIDASIERSAHFQKCSKSRFPWIDGNQVWGIFPVKGRVGILSILWLPERRVWASAMEPTAWVLTKDLDDCSGSPPKSNPLGVKRGDVSLACPSPWA